MDIHQQLLYFMSVHERGKEPQQSPFSNAIAAIEFVPRFVRSQTRAYDTAQAPTHPVIVHPILDLAADPMDDTDFIEIHPVLVERLVDGARRTFHVYPGTREERVEKAFLRLATDHRHTTVVVDKNGGMRIAVEFTLRQLNERLDDKKTSHGELAEALHVWLNSPIRRIRVTRTKSGRIREIRSTYNLMENYHEVVDAQSTNDDRYNSPRRVVLGHAFSTFIVNRAIAHYSCATVMSVSDSPLARFILMYLLVEWRSCAFGRSFDISTYGVMSKFGGIYNDDYCREPGLVAPHVAEQLSTALGRRFAVDDVVRLMSVDETRNPTPEWIRLLEEFEGRTISPENLPQVVRATQFPLARRNWATYPIHYTADMVRRALNKLKAQGLLARIDRARRLTSCGVVVDVKYPIHPTEALVRLVVNSHRLQRDRDAQFPVEPMQLLNIATPSQAIAALSKVPPSTGETSAATTFDLFGNTV